MHWKYKQGKSQKNIIISWGMPCLSIFKSDDETYLPYLKEYSILEIQWYGIFRFNSVQQKSQDIHNF